MKSTSAFASFLMVLCYDSMAHADTVVLGYPLDYIATGVLNPGLGEATTAEVVSRMGQTFTVPTGHPYLTTFSFWLGDSPVFEPQPTTFNAVLMAYGTDRPVGEALFQGDIRSMAGLQHGENRRFDFNVGVSLAPLASYVVFLDVVPYLDGVPNFATFSSQGADVYSGGTLVRSTSTTGLEHVFDSPWQEGGLGWDLVFRAEFQSVPETSSVVLLGTALGAPLALGRRRLSVS